MSETSAAGPQTVRPSAMQKLRRDLRKLARAKGTARIDSDWDLFIFENEQVLSELRSAESEVNQIFDRKISSYDPK